MSSLHEAECQEWLSKAQSELQRLARDATIADSIYKTAFREQMDDHPEAGPPAGVSINATSLSETTDESAIS